MQFLGKKFGMDVDLPCLDVAMKAFSVVTSRQ
jgi:hypothetical protein